MKQPKTTQLRFAAALAVAALALTGCGAGDSGDTRSAQSPIAASEPFNEADAAFTADMIPHHQQALAMVEMTEGRDLDPAFEKLTEDIRDAQAPEIDVMSGWREDWGLEQAGESGRPGMGSGAMDSDDTGDMGAMMSEDEFASLEKADDADFESMWLRMMIEHHEGAIEMARAEVADGEYQPAVDLAGQVAASQQAEITTMKQMAQ
jgi:uncharacterized protein (DUF305 family)